MIRSAFLKISGIDGHAPLYAAENDAYARLLNEEQKAEADRKKTEFEALRKKAKPKYPLAHAVQGGGKAMQVYIRGNPASKGEWVARGTLEILEDEPRPTDPEAAKKHPFSRLDLAEAIASSAEPSHRPRDRKPRLAVALRERPGDDFKQLWSFG